MFSKSYVFFCPLPCNFVSVVLQRDAAYSEQNIKYGKIVKLSNCKIVKL